jgi:hypothetical protein
MTIALNPKTFMRGRRYRATIDRRTAAALFPDYVPNSILRSLVTFW